MGRKKKVTENNKYSADDYKHGAESDTSYT